MPAKHGRKESDVVRIESYNSIRKQLEAENAALMKERSSIQQQSRYQILNQPTRPGPVDHETNEIQSSPIPDHQSPPRKYSQDYVYETLKSKIHEIIHICGENVEGGTLDEVVSAEMQILDYLQLLKHQQTKRSSPPAQKSSKKKKPKLNKTENYEHRQSKQSFREILGDQALSMIQQIERKALIEIESLRADKIALMKRLNQQIRSHNAEKKSRIISASGHTQRQHSTETHHRKSQPKFMEVVQEQENEDLYEGVQSSHGKQSNLQVESKIKSTSKNESKTKSKFHPQNENVASNQHLGSGFPYEQNNPHVHKVFPEQAMDEHQQIQNLRAENMRIKQNLAVKDPGYKGRLRSELQQLSGKIYHYQQALSQISRNQPNLNINGELSELLQQGQHLNEAGNRLLQGQKQEEYRTTMGSFENEDNYARPSSRVRDGGRKVQSRGTFDYSRPQLQTFSPMDKSYHSQNFKSGFSPSKYEQLIHEMNAVK